MKSWEQVEIAMPGSYSWMPYAPQEVKGLDDDDDVCKIYGAKLVTCPTNETTKKSVTTGSWKLLVARLLFWKQK
jgi:hypothetical protein